MSANTKRLKSSHILFSIYTVCAISISLISIEAPAEEVADNINSTRYSIVLTGGELLRGVYADGHTLFLTRTLGPLGCQCVTTACVGDSEQELIDALSYAEKNADFIIVTGGLGPTDDDVTRETLSKFTGIALQENPEAMQTMLKRFGIDDREKLRKNLQRQTMTPEKGAYLPNTNGTAVGLIFDTGSKVIVALPGPPRELQPMVTGHLLPYLSQRFSIRRIGASIRMRFVGIGESQIDETMHTKMDWPNDVMVSSLFDLGRVDLTLSLPNDTQQDHERLETLKTKLAGLIGEYMYSDSDLSLEECVLNLLIKRQNKLVTAEIGSGGAIAAALSRAEGASEVYLGGCTAPDMQKIIKVLGMAQTEGRTNTDNEADDLLKKIAGHICQSKPNVWALVVGPAIREPESTPYFKAVLGTLEDGFEIKRISLRGHGEIVNSRQVNQSLDWLRRKLLETTN